MTRIWTPVGDGQYGLYNGLEVDADGAQISMTAIDVYGVEHPVEETLPPDFALCQATEDAAPVPLDMPDEVRDTIRGLLESGIVGTKSAIRGRDYHGLRSFNEEDWLRRYQEALAWLDTMPWQAQPSEEGDE
jgi:hypothetical protein